MKTGEIQIENRPEVNEELFHQAMLAQVTDSIEIDPFAVYVLRRVRRDGGLPTANKMLAKRGQQTGLMRLWLEGRLDISLEALVLQAEFQPLFSKKELDTARQRLIALDFPVD